MTTPPDDTTESLREQVESVIEDDHEGSEMLAILIVDRVILPALERQREDARATLRTVEEMQRTVAAGLRAEAERLRGELATARRSHAEYDELLRGVLVSRDANIERAESAEAEMKRQRQRAEQAEATVARAERLRDIWLAYPLDDMHHAAGLMLGRYLSSEAFGSDAPASAEETPDA